MKKGNRIFLITALTFLLLSVMGYVIFNIQYPRYQEVNIAPQAWKETFWEDKAVIRGNSSDLKIHSCPDKDKIQTTKIRLYITRTHDEDNTQRISEVYVYGKVPVTFFNVFLTKVVHPVKYFLSQAIR